MSTTTFTETLSLVSRASADPIAQAVPAPLVKYYEAAIQEGPCGPAEAIALITTDRVDRDGEVVLPQGARLENYKRNPILMWGHAKGLPSEGKAGIPIGKNLWIKPDREGSGLIAKHLFDTKDDFSATICNKVKDEFLKCYSITFLDIESGPPTAQEIKKRPDWKNAKKIYRQWELIEYSVVAFPSNVDAVTLAKRDKTMDEITTAVDSPDLEHKQLEDQTETIPESDPVSKDDYPGETEEEEEAEEEAENEMPFAPGDHVKCNSKMCKGYGVVKSVHKDGLVPDVDDDVMGTIESPAARVQMYKKYGDGWKPTMIHRGMMMSDMEATETLKPPGKEKAAAEPKEFTWSETEKATYKAAVMNSPDFLKLAEQRIMERFDVLLGRV